MNKYIAEFVGTFALVFCGTGAIIINEVSQGTVTHVGIALTFGLIVMAMIYTYGEVSGAHINPAVTLGFYTAGRLALKEVPYYIISQVLGAVLASLTLSWLFADSHYLGATLPAGSWQQTFFLEIILTFFLMLVIINVATGSKEQGLMAGIAIGATVALEAMFAGPISGASMNPARSLGPAVVSGNLQFLWIYLVAPGLGSIMSVLVWKITVNTN